MTPTQKPTEKECRAMRIQRKRTKGWRMPENTVYVGRPTVWGNPFIVGKEIPFLKGRNVQDKRHAASLYLGSAWQNEKLINTAWTELKGKNLACFCKLCDLHKDGKPLDSNCPYCDPCHADTLLEIANAPQPPHTASGKGETD